MSDDIDHITWIERSIEEQHIRYYDYKRFVDVKVIGSGGFGKVYRANWMQKDFALKSFNSDNSTVKEIVNEIKLHRLVDFHDNIIRFFGITKNDSDEYLLVIEYADGGTLRNYLENNFSNLTWNDKYMLALQISSAVECLHEEKIVHRDLHSNNILIHHSNYKRLIKLADFGLSKRIGDSTKLASNLFGVIPYVDPKGFSSTRRNREVTSPGGKKSEKYKLNEKSDVYSVGVLFWELSSGKKPFNDDEYDLSLAMDIMRGHRESIVEGTPKEYSDLYTKCWDDDPHKRPTIQQVTYTLMQIVPKSFHESMVSPIVSPIVSPKSSREVTGIASQEIANIESSNLSKFIDNFHLLTTKDLSNVITAPVITAPVTPNTKLDYFCLVSELIKLFLKMTDEGKSREERRSTLDDYLSSHDVNMKKIYDWLNNNSNYMSDPSYIFFIGYLNFSGFGTTINVNKAFEYFYKASLRHYPTAQYYLGLCYEFGFGATIDKQLAFKWYEKSASQSVSGNFALGICYEKGVGVKKDYQMAFNWYLKAADNNHAMAQHNVGDYYRLGSFVKRDYNKAFYYYKLSADSGYSFGINMLGYCYSEGIGISPDKKMAFNLYLKAANMNNNVAQFNVAVCFDDGIGIKKDFNKAMDWYKKSADNGYDRAIKKLNLLNNQYHQQKRISSSPTTPDIYQNVSFPIPQPYYPNNQL